MALTYTYADAYLRQNVTEEREARAADHVAALGAAFSSEWAGRLTQLRAYIVTCLECQAQPDDLFAQKLKHYSQEWAATLAQARAATPAADGKPTPMFFMQLDRS